MKKGRAFLKKPDPFLRMAWLACQSRADELVGKPREGLTTEADLMEGQRGAIQARGLLLGRRRSGLGCRRSNDCSTATTTVATVAIATAMATAVAAVATMTTVTPMTVVATVAATMAAMTAIAAVATTIAAAVTAAIATVATVTGLRLLLTAR